MGKKVTVTTLSKQKLTLTEERRRAYRNRIDELAGYGLEEGISVSVLSEEDFWAFMESSGFTNRAGLALMDNGNLRAVWKGADKGADSDHLGVQFLGKQMAEYVIFKRRPDSANVSRVAGIDTLSGIREQVKSFGLTSLVKT